MPRAFSISGPRSQGGDRKGGGSSLVSKDVKQVPPVKAQAFLYEVKGAWTTRKLGTRSFIA